MSNQTSDNNKRIAKNTLFLYLRMFVMMVVSLFTSRVVLAVLGAQDYGIYNIIGGVIVLFSFLNSALIKFKYMTGSSIFFVVILISSLVHTCLLFLDVPPAYDRFFGFFQCGKLWLSLSCLAGSCGGCPFSEPPSVWRPTCGTGCSATPSC